MEKTEYDVSAIAWETYKSLYRSNFNNFDIIKNRESRQFIEGTFSLEGKTTGVLSFSGEIDFNFKASFGNS